MNNNFIPCCKWVKRGVAKAQPHFVQLSRKELSILINDVKCGVDTTLGIKEAGTTDETNNMDDSDKEGDGGHDLVNIANIESLDDVAEIGTEDGEEENYSEDSEKEDDEIKPNDNLIAVGHVYNDMSILEVYVFNEEDNDFYVHHDIVLPTIPLALEWLSYPQDLIGPKNLIAVGGMNPVITIWDLDLVNDLEPFLKLGVYSRKKKYQHRNHGHRDAVLDLSWNKRLQHVLASSSVDGSVLLWDVVKTTAVSEFHDFKEKVQTIEWHPSEVNILLAGACDSTVRLMDCRLGEALHTIEVDGEVEKIVWHPTSQFTALVGTSKGMLSCADCRTGKLLWTLKAHDKEITGVAVHEDAADRLVTCSADETLKVWSLIDEPILSFTKHTNHGELQCLQLCPENSDILCVGGDSRNNNFKIYNLSTEMQEQMTTGETEIN